MNDFDAVVSINSGKLMNTRDARDTVIELNKLIINKYKKLVME